MNVDNLNNAQKIANTIGMKEISNDIDSFLKTIEARSSKPRIVNAGLLKAGKSSLFNAIAGKEAFATDVVRATIVNKSVELEKYILIDTPGLDANDADTKVAVDGYKNADIIVFVHNVVEGELNKIEIDAIKVLLDMLEDTKSFVTSSVLVLSHADQLEEEVLNKITEMIKGQCKKLFKAEFGNVIAVNSNGYIKGIIENKKLLIEASNINTLKRSLDELLSKYGQDTYFDGHLKKVSGQIIEKMNVEIERSEKERSKYSSNISDTTEIVNAKQKVHEKIKSIIARLRSESTIPSQGPYQPYFSYDERSYKEYKSEYEAKRAAKEACESAIKSAAAASRTVALNAVAYYESYIAPDGKVNTLKNELFNAYNEIKELYYKVVKSNEGIPAFDIKLKKDSTTERLIKEFGYTYDNAKYIAVQTFKSADYYLTRYSCNMYIDYDYHTEYVYGLFGNREKQVKYYKWEIEGAIDDISDSAKEIIDSKLEYGKEKANQLYSYYIDDLIDQFQNLTELFIKQFDTKISQSEANSKKILKKKEEIESKLMNLDKLKKMIEGI